MKWIAYGGVSEEFGGCWFLAVLGPMDVTTTVQPDMDVSGEKFPLLGEWDHEPSEDEKKAVTPEEYQDDDLLSELTHE